MPAGSEPRADAWFCWCDASGRPAPAPQAWQAGWLRLDGLCADWESLSLGLEDQPLPLMLTRSGGERLLLAQWPARSAGFWRLALSRQAQPLAAADVFVGSPLLGQDQWLALLAELRYRLPARLLLRASGGHVPVGPAALAVSPEEELALLLPLLETLGEALAWLQSRALAAPRLQGDWRRLERARRPAPQHLAARLARGAYSPRTPVWDLQPVMSLDQPENRFVAGVMQALLRRVRGLQAYLRQSGAPCERLTRSAPALEAAWAMHPLAGLSPRAQPPANHHLLARPAYAVFLRTWQVLRFGWLPGQGRETLPYRDLALLYQHWCLLQIADGLLDWGRRHGWQARLDPDIRPGRPVLSLQRGPLCLSLIPEASYHPASTLLPAEEPLSLSRPQRPDQSLRLTSGGRLLGLWVFDAKFRSEADAPLKDDLDKLHAYRDAIRRPDGSPLIERAVLMYPGACSTYPPALEAWRMLPGEPGRTEMKGDKNGDLKADMIEEQISGSRADSAGEPSGIAASLERLLKQI